MKRDGRSLDHQTLEVIRTMAVERVREGASPSAVVAYGFCRTTIYKWRKAASPSGPGLLAKLLDGRPRKLTARQENMAWILGSGRGQTSVIERPGQRQTISAASALNSPGAFWCCTYEGGLNAELFAVLLKRMMRGRRKPVHLVVDGSPSHKTTLVKNYAASTDGLLTLHFLPGYGPNLNPDELVWSHMKRTGCGANTAAKRRKNRSSA